MTAISDVLGATHLNTGVLQLSGCVISQNNCKSPDSPLLTDVDRNSLTCLGTYIHWYLATYFPLKKTIFRNP